MQKTADKHGIALKNYDDLWKWSISEPAKFWEDIWKYTAINSHKTYNNVCHLDDFRIASEHATNSPRSWTQRIFSILALTSSKAQD